MSYKAKYDAILGQWEREDFYNHLSNYTKIQYNTIQYNTTQRNATQRNAMQYNSLFTFPFFLHIVTVFLHI